VAFTASDFYVHLADGRLMGSLCDGCGAISVPPRPFCPRCSNPGSQWVRLQGKGRLAAFTAISVAPSGMLKEGFDRIHPYCSGVVELDEGPRVSARVLGVDAGQPESIVIGTPMVLEVLRDADGTPKPVVAFRAVPR
jgi:uncharacterized OB-fold protein